MPTTDGTAASTRRGRGTGASCADDGSEDNLGFEYRQVPRLCITLALMLSDTGVSVGNIQMTLGHLGVKVHADTITRILGNTVPLFQGGGTVYGYPQAPVRRGQVRLRRETSKGPRQGVVYRRRHGPRHPVCAGVGRLAYQ